jgi:hypothetical protein
LTVSEVESFWCKYGFVLLDFGRLLLDGFNLWGLLLLARNEIGKLVVTSSFEFEHFGGDLDSLGFLGLLLFFGGIVGF